jgi:hypothetical protein
VLDRPLPTSLRFRIDGLRAAWNGVAQNAPSIVLLRDPVRNQCIADGPRNDSRRDCVRSPNVARSVTGTSDLRKTLARGRARSRRVTPPGDDATAESARSAIAEFLRDRRQCLGIFGGELFRIPVNADGGAGTIVKIETSMLLSRPGGLRTGRSHSTERVDERSTVCPTSAHDCAHARVPAPRHVARGRVTVFASAIPIGKRRLFQPRQFVGPGRLA